MNCTGVVLRGICFSLISQCVSQFVSWLVLKRHAMPRMGWRQSSTHLILALDMAEWSAASCTGRLTHWTGGWVGPRGGDEGQSLCPCRESNPVYPARGVLTSVGCYGYFYSGASSSSCRTVMWLAVSTLTLLLGRKLP